MTSHEALGSSVPLFTFMPSSEHDTNFTQSVWFHRLRLIMVEYAAIIVVIIGVSHIDISHFISKF